MEHYLEKRKDNIPERLLIWFKSMKGYYSKDDLATVISCSKESLSSAFSKLRRQDKVITMQWSYEIKSWTYNIK